MSVGYDTFYWLDWELDREFEREQQQEQEKDNGTRHNQDKQ